MAEKGSTKCIQVGCASPRCNKSHDADGFLLQYYIHHVVKMQALASYALLVLTLATDVLAADQSPPIAIVANGTYEGLYLSIFNQDAFLGVPFAQSTADGNRFRIPQSLNETWTGIRTAHNYSEACPDYSPGDWTYGVGENCLSINIVKPAGCENESLPVVMWIHGGS